MEIADASGGLWLRPGWDGGQGYENISRRYPYLSKIDGTVQCIVSNGVPVKSYLLSLTTRKTIRTCIKRFLPLPRIFLK